MVFNFSLSLFILILTLIERISCNLYITAYNHDGSSNYHRLIEKEFDNYCKENGLNNNVTIGYPESDFHIAEIDYPDFMDRQLKKSHSYSTFFYNVKYLKQFADNLAPLDELIPKDVINKIDPNIIEACKYNNKLIAFPIKIYVDILLSNNEYSNYTIPSAWNELLTISKKIHRNNKDKNLKQYVTYYENDNTEGTDQVIFEFIFSYLKADGSIDIHDSQFANALEMLKNVLSISTPYTSNTKENIIDTYVKSKKAIFVKESFTNYNSNSDYKALYTPSLLPKNKDNGSKVKNGSVISLEVMSVNIKKYDSIKDKLKEFIKFLTDENVQKQLSIKGKELSILNNIYKNEVCEALDCDFIVKMQPYSVINFKNIKMANYSVDQYLKRFRGYILNFINGALSTEKAIHSIELISKYYSFTIKSDDTKNGLYIAILLCAVIFIMGLSIVVLFNEKTKSNFMFLPNNLWILFIFGCIMMLCSIITFYGSINDFKCKTRRLLLSVGYITSLTPILYKLIENFPESNKKSVWVKKNKAIFISIIILISIVLNILLFIGRTIRFKNIIVEKKENFRQCVTDNLFGEILIIISKLYELLITLSILLLSLLGWNLEINYREPEKIFFASVLNILFYTVFALLKYDQSEIYMKYYLSCILKTFVISLINYTFIFGIRIFKKKNDDENKNTNENNKDDIENEKAFISKYPTNTESSLVNLINKIIIYHNRKCIPGY